MRSIPFSTPMIQANAEGRKNQTRRTRGLKLINEHPEWFWLSSESFIDNKGRLCQKLFSAKMQNPIAVCPYGKVGDVLYVRETFAIISIPDGTTANKLTTVFKADNELNHLVTKWTPSIFMPQKAARTFIKITDIKLQQLKELTEEDAMDEGIIKFSSPLISYAFEGGNSPIYPTAVHAYKALWQKINGPNSWNNEEWVWRICYEILKN